MNSADAAPRPSANGQETANPRGVDVNLRSGPQMREYEAIADRVAADNPRLVLDWGCGWGHVSVLMRERGLSVNSLDYRDDLDTDGPAPMERFPQHEVYLTTQPVALPYGDSAFDAVLSLGVLEHVYDPVGSLAEIRRVLRPGGTLYVYKLPNRHSYLEWIARRAGMYYHGAYEHDVVYTRESARMLIEGAGFTVTELRLANMLPLTVTGAAATWLTPVIWALNRALARVPGLARLSTNIDLVAVAP